MYLRKCHNIALCRLWLKCSSTWDTEGSSIGRRGGARDTITTSTRSVREGSQRGDRFTTPLFCQPMQRLHGESPWALETQEATTATHDNTSSMLCVNMTSHAGDSRVQPSDPTSTEPLVAPVGFILKKETGFVKSVGSSSTAFNDYLCFDRWLFPTWANLKPKLKVKILHNESHIKNRYVNSHIWPRKCT